MRKMSIWFFCCLWLGLSGPIRTSAAPKKKQKSQQAAIQKLLNQFKSQNASKGNLNPATDITANIQILNGGAVVSKSLLSVKDGLCHGAAPGPVLISDFA